MHNNDKPERRGDTPRPTRSRALALTFSAASLLALPWQSHAFTPGWSCDGGARSAECEIRISPNLRLEAPVKAIKNAGDSNRVELQGNLVLITPAVELPLVEARLVAVFDPTGKTPMELYGTARAPLDKLPLLSDANLETVPGMAVGLVQPETIHGLLGDDLPLNDGPALDGSRRESVDPYFLFHVDLGLSMAIDLGKDAKAGTSLSLEVPGSDSATFILDPLDPYFYVAKGRSIQFPDTSKRGLYDQYTVVTHEKTDKKGRLVATIHEHYNTRGRLVNKYRHNAKNGTLVEHRYERAGKVTVTFFEPNGRGGYRQEGSDGKNGRYISANEVEKGRKSRLRREDGDQDKDKDKEADDSPLEAFGYSRHGWIQFEAKTAEGIPKESRRFSGQLFLQGSVPFGKFVTLDGDVVTYAGKQGFSQGGNGLLSLSLPGLPDFVDFSLELGNASAALQIVEDRQMTYFSGVLEPDTLFFDDIMPVFPAAGAKASGYIDNGLGDAHVTIEGQMDIGADVLGDWIGVDLNSLQMTKAKAKIDTRRMIVAGMTKVQIHPSIDIGGEVYAEASVDWASPEQASLYLYGDMTVFGVGLKDVSLSISRRGMLVNGAFVTPLSRIGLSGSITDQGPMLTGSAGVMFGLGGISAAMKAAANTLTAAQTEVNRLDGLIAAARKVVNSERERNRARLQSARNAVGVAQNQVNSINGKISAEYRMISKRKSEIASWNRWRKKAKWYQVADRAGRYSYEAGWRNADIGRRYTTIAGLKTALGGAKVALAVAQEALRAVEKIIATIPVDADPRVAALIAASKTAWVALEAAKLPFKNVPVIKGAFEGQIKVKLEIRGISGKASAAFDGYPLLAGDVVFARKPKACITLPGFGNVCAKI